MTAQRIVGIILVVVGVILFVIGMNASDSFADQASNFFTGSFTDSTMWYIIGGIVVALGGIGLVVFGGRKAISSGG